MASGKFFLVALGSLLLYTLFINFGYLNFMGDNANIYNVYLYDPAGTYTQASPLIRSAASGEELDKALARDTSGGVGIRIKGGKPSIVLYAKEQKKLTGTEQTMRSHFCILAANIRRKLWGTIPRK